MKLYDFNRIGPAMALTVVIVAALVLFGGPSSEESTGARVLGARVQPTATSTAVALATEQNTTGQDATAAPVPAATNVADEGVVVTVPPTPTPDAAPANAAPAVVGAPVVLALTEDGLSGPNVIRPGQQTWAFVSKADVALQVGVFEASADQASLRVDGEGLVAVTDVIAALGAFNWPLELDPANYWRATFTADGTLLAFEPFTIVP